MEGLIAILAIFIGLPWLFLHYLTKNRASGRLDGDEERMLEDLWKSARGMERRVETLERLLEDDAPVGSRAAMQPTRRGYN